MYVEKSRGNIKQRNDENTTENIQCERNCRTPARHRNHERQGEKHCGLLTGQRAQRGNLLPLEKRYSGLHPDQAKRLKEPEKENNWLKKLLAEVMLDNQILKDIGSGNL